MTKTDLDNISQTMSTAKETACKMTMKFLFGKVDFEAWASKMATVCWDLWDKLEKALPDSFNNQEIPKTRIAAIMLFEQDSSPFVYDDNRHCYRPRQLALL